MRNFRSLLVLVVLVSCASIGCAAPQPPSSSVSTTETSLEDTTDSNSNDTGVPQDLYVIKTIVYEVGILTDAGNDTEDNATHEQVNLTFFDPSHNGSLIDLSNIPVPIQTNVSGVAVTGLLPANLGSLVLPQNGNQSQSSSSDSNQQQQSLQFNSDSNQQSLLPQPATLAIPDKQITVTQNISTTDPQRGAQIISNLPQLLGLQTNAPTNTDNKGTGDDQQQQVTTELDATHKHVV